MRSATAKNTAKTSRLSLLVKTGALFGLLACYQAGASVSRDYVSVFQKKAKAPNAAGAAQLQKQLRKDIARLASLFSGDEAKTSQAFEIKAKAANLAKDLNSRRFHFAAQKNFLLKKAKKLKPRLSSKQIARRNGLAQKESFGAFRLSQRRIQ